MTIRDCLRMATCYEAGSSYKPTDPDWARTFFTAEVSHKPGQVYAYCTTATTMLCMIIQKAGGQEFMSVLRPVFDEIGVSQGRLLRGNALRTRMGRLRCVPDRA